MQAVLRRYSGRPAPVWGVLVEQRRPFSVSALAAPTFSEVKFAQEDLTKVMGEVPEFKYYEMKEPVPNPYEGITMDYGVLGLMTEPHQVFEFGDFCLPRAPVISPRALGGSLNGRPYVAPDGCKGILTLFFWLAVVRTHMVAWGVFFLDTALLSATLSAV